MVVYQNNITMLLLFLTIVLNSTSLSPLVYDFGKNQAGNDWYIVNDGVMGGLSQGYVEFTDEYLRFSGDISLENNGGFTSFRSPYGRFDLSGYHSIEIRYRSSGRSCAFTMDQHTQFWLPKHRIPLAVTDGEWKTVRVELLDIDTYRLGKKMGSKMTSDQTKRVIRIGLITDSKSAGAFSLDIDYISFQ